jgi:hypothetical protein
MQAVAGNLNPWAAESVTGARRENTGGSVVQEPPPASQDVRLNCEYINNIASNLFSEYYSFHIVRCCEGQFTNGTPADAGCCGKGMTAVSEKRSPSCSFSFVPYPTEKIRTQGGINP